MACTESILARCPDCNSEDIKRNGKSRTYLQRYVCKRCSRNFQTSYHYRAWKPEVRALIAPMTMRNSGIRDIENVLGIHRDSVMAVIKAEADKIPVEPLPTKKQKVATAELDEFWSFAPQLKGEPAMDMVCLGCTQKTHLGISEWSPYNASCKKLCDELFTRYDIRRYNTDGWKSYSKMLPPSRHRISKKGTQRIERQNLNFRTHIKRLNRRTICFSTSEIMHDAVIKL